MLYFLTSFSLYLSIKELQSNDIGMGSVHASHHHAISYHCGVDRVPAIVAIVDGRVFHYTGHLQARSIRNFVKNTIPSWVITEVGCKPQLLGVYKSNSWQSSYRH